MLQIPKKLTQSNFARSVVIVATGTAGAQAITMAFAPIITRIYGPESFGMLGAFTAIMAIIMPIAALSYPIAIVLPKFDKVAVGLGKLSALLSLAFTGLLIVIIAIFVNPIARLLNLEIISKYLLLVPLAVVFAAFGQILQQWLIRKKQFKITAFAAILQALIINSAKVGIGLFYPVGAALIVVTTMGHAILALILWLGIKNESEANRSGVEEPGVDLLALARRYKDFAIYRTPQISINVMSQGLPILILSSFFGPAAAGYYTLGNTVMGAPTVLIGKSISDVFYPRITEAVYCKEKLFHLVLKTTFALAAIGIIPFGLIVACGPWLFSIIFGAEWYIAGEYARWLSLWFYSILLTMTVAKTVLVLALQKFDLYFTVYKTSVRISCMLAAIYIFQSDIISIAVISIASLVTNMHYILVVIYKARMYDKQNSV